jgi:hypothetical protein
MELVYSLYFFFVFLETQVSLRIWIFYLLDEICVLTSVRDPAKTGWTREFLSGIRRQDRPPCKSASHLQSNCKLVLHVLWSACNWFFSMKTRVCEMKRNGTKRNRTKRKWQGRETKRNETKFLWNGNKTERNFCETSKVVFSDRVECPKFERIYVCNY